MPVPPGKLTDRWQLLCSYDPDTKEIRPILHADNHWRNKRFSYENGNMVYKGFHEALQAATDDEEWRIWKYTYDASDNPVLIEGPIIGSWDNRESLGWT